MKGTLIWKDAMPKIYTRYGDEGTTGLLYGGRVSKTDPRCEAYGTTDEAISALGLARSLSEDSKVKEIILQIQRDLFTLGAELATDPGHYKKFLKYFQPTTKTMVTHLENILDSLNAELSLPRSFIIPGASPASAALDIARSTLRRAERLVVGLKETNLLVNDEVLRYLNRLADLVFILARYEDRALTLESLTGQSESP
jgi:cob(I)alamin adenosyltransferase